jgi:NAD(P)-dependent dehydrogenase (short-subunit alcohol dehydrogenase family)
MSRFTNKIVVITGGTSGIGRAAARQFIKDGAKVAVTGRSPQCVDDAQKEIGANGIAIAAHVTKSAELDSLFQQVREKYGGIDVLYANAGIAKRLRRVGDLVDRAARDPGCVKTPRDRKRGEWFSSDRSKSTAFTRITLIAIRRNIHSIGSAQRSFLHSQDPNWTFNCGIGDYVFRRGSLFQRPDCRVVM